MTSEPYESNHLSPYTVDLKDLKLPMGEIDPVTMYGQFAQDLFVIAMTQGKQNGTYLEIGCGYPSGGGTNTFALETTFNWSGASIDSGRDTTEGWRSLAEDWAAHRPQANFLQTDAFLLDYSTFPKYFDYLQIDIDPAVESFGILEKITSHIKFSIITFEHDYGLWSKDPQDKTALPFHLKNRLVRSQSREYLLDLGYTLIIPDVHLCEDWWVDTTIISADVIKAYMQMPTKEPQFNHWKKVLLK